MRNIPTITKNLLIINFLAFLVTMLLRNVIDLNSILGLHFFMASDFMPYQLITYMFIHAGFTHILFNMFALWMFGCIMERTWGPKRFLIFYLVCGVGAGVIQEITQFFWIWYRLNDQQPISFMYAFNVMHHISDQLNGLTTVGASGAIYGILLGFGMTYPDERMFIFPLPMPIKAKWLVTGYVAIELFLALGMPGDNVAHFAHLGGMLFGYFMIRYWRKTANTAGKYDYYTTKSSFFDNMKAKWQQRSSKNTSNNTFNQHTTVNDDWNYNANKKSQQAEIDVILDKIRRSGYDSLSREEKQKLFDQKNN